MVGIQMRLKFLGLEALIKEMPRIRTFSKKSVTKKISPSYTAAIEIFNMELAMLKPLQERDVSTLLFAFSSFLRLTV